MPLPSPAPAAALLLALALAACDSPPGIAADPAPPPGAAPVLLPLDGILQAADAAAAGTADPAPTLSARAAALRARAAAMRGQITDPATRARLEQAAG